MKPFFGSKVKFASKILPNNNFLDPDEKLFWDSGNSHCCQPTKNSAKKLKTGREKKLAAGENWRP